MFDRWLKKNEQPKSDFYPKAQDATQSKDAPASVVAPAAIDKEAHLPDFLKSPTFPESICTNYAFERFQVNETNEFKIYADTVTKETKTVVAPAEEALIALEKAIKNLPLPSESESSSVKTFLKQFKQLKDDYENFKKDDVYKKIESILPSVYLAVDLKTLYYIVSTEFIKETLARAVIMTAKRLLEAEHPNKPLNESEVEELFSYSSSGFLIVDLSLNGKVKIDATVTDRLKDSFRSATYTEIETYFQILRERATKIAPSTVKWSLTSTILYDELMAADQHITAILKETCIMIPTSRIGHRGPSRIGFNIAEGIKRDETFPRVIQSKLADYHSKIQNQEDIQHVLNEFKLKKSEDVKKLKNKFDDIAKLAIKFKAELDVIAQANLISAAKAEAEKAYHKAKDRLDAKFGAIQAAYSYVTTVLNAKFVYSEKSVTEIQTITQSIDELFVAYENQLATISKDINESKDIELIARQTKNLESLYKTLTALEVPVFHTDANELVKDTYADQQEDKKPETELEQRLLLLYKLVEFKLTLEYKALECKKTYLSPIAIPDTINEAVLENFNSDVTTKVFNSQTAIRMMQIMEPDLKDLNLSSEKSGEGEQQSSQQIDLCATIRNDLTVFRDKQAAELNNINNSALVVSYNKRMFCQLLANALKSKTWQTAESGVRLAVDGHEYVVPNAIYQLMLTLHSESKWMGTGAIELDTKSASKAIGKVQAKCAELLTSKDANLSEKQAAFINCIRNYAQAEFNNLDYAKQMSADLAKQHKDLSRAFVKFKTDDKLDMDLAPAGSPSALGVTFISHYKARPVWKTLATIGLGILLVLGITAAIVLPVVGLPVAIGALTTLVGTAAASIGIILGAYTLATTLGIAGAVIAGIGSAIGLGLRKCYDKFKNYLHKKSMKAYAAAVEVTPSDSGSRSPNNEMAQAIPETRTHQIEIKPAKLIEQKGFEVDPPQGVNDAIETFLSTATIGLTNPLKPAEEVRVSQLGILGTRTQTNSPATVKEAMEESRVVEENNKVVPLFSRQ